MDLIKFGDRCKRVRSEELPAARQAWGSFPRPGLHVHVCRTCFLWPYMAGTPHVTLHTLTPLAGFLTFSWALEAARGGRAQQQRVRCRALDARDPSTIIPNTPTPAARVARTPSATADAHCSFAARAGRPCEDGGRCSSSMGQGLHLSSWGRAPSRGPWWWWCRTLFAVDPCRFMPSVLRFSALAPGDRGSGTMRARGPAHCRALCTCSIVSELIFIVLDLIPMLTCSLLGSQQDLAQRGWVHRAADFLRALRLPLAGAAFT